MLSALKANRQGAGWRWVILAVVYLAVFAFAMVLQSVPPVLSLIIDEMGLSHARAGLLMSLFAAPGIILSIPAGLVADRYGQSRVVLLSFLGIIAGVAIFATANSFLTLSLGRAVAGMGAVTLLVVTPQLLAQWFAGRELGVAMGVFNTAVPTGTIVSFSLFSAVADSSGWRTSIWISAAVCGVAMIAFALFFAPAPVQHNGGDEKLQGLLPSIKGAGLPIWLVGLAWMFFNASLISLFTFTPDFLTTRGYSIGYAGFVTGVVMWPTLLLSPFVGYLIDKLGSKEVFIGIGGVALVIFIILVPGAAAWIIPLVVLIGIAQALVPSAIFALPPDVMKPETLGLGFGIISTFLSLGMVAGPFSVGLARDATGLYQVSYTLMAAFALMVAVSIFFLRWRRSQKA